MIVCHCRVVNDDTIAHAIDQGARSVAQICGATGAGRDCGSCVFTLKRLLCQHEGSAQQDYAEVDGAAS